MPDPLPLSFMADLAEGLDGRVLDVSATSGGHALADGEVEELAEFVLPLGEAQVIARGRTLHVFNGPDWYRVEVTAL